MIGLYGMLVMTVTGLFLTIRYIVLPLTILGLELWIEYDRRHK